LSNLEVQRPQVNIVCGLDSGEDASGSRLPERAARMRGWNALRVRKAIMKPVCLNAHRSIKRIS
jgi:hypothetical protein